VVALKPQPLELKITFDTIDGFGEAKSVAPILAIVLAKATTHFSGITNPTFSHTIRKDEKTNMVVEIGMERGILILAQLEPIVTFATTCTGNSFCNYKSKNKC